MRRHAAAPVRGQLLLICGLVAAGLISSCSTGPTLRAPEDRPLTVVYQPSHQTDTGTDYSEAAVCNGIAAAAVSAHSSGTTVHKVWSYDVPGLRYARQGSNTLLEHTSRIVGDSLTGYAWELKTSNALRPDVFISIHNNGATNAHAIWGFIHEGDRFEEANRKLAGLLIEAIAASTGLQSKGVLYDSSVGRNDYRCVATGKQAFYSIDENVNTAPYRVLLEIGDNAVSREFLQDPAKQKLMGMIIARVIEETFAP